MNILIIGAGFCGKAIFRKIKLDFPHAPKGMSYRQNGVLEGFDYGFQFGDPYDFSTVSHLIMTAPPSPTDPFLNHYGLCEFTSLKQIIYLSTTAVYGDHQGGYVYETTPSNPLSERAKNRLMAENDWLDFGLKHKATVTLFRLSGLYGYGRNTILDLLGGEARRVEKKGQVFNRIHEEDVALGVSNMISSHFAGIVNGADNYPSPSHEVVLFAAELLKIEPPPLIPYEKADFSPMGKSFWVENKRIDNQRLKSLVGELLYPTYREGLLRIYADLKSSKRFT